METKTEVKAEEKAPETKTETLITSPETKAEETKTETKTETKVETKKEEDYSKIALPKDSKLTAKDLEASIAQAKKEGRSADVVQLLLNERDAAMKSYEASEVQRVKDEVPKWVEQMKADKEIGGADFPKHVENAKRVLNKYAPQEFKEFLEKTQLGNHPMMVKTFAMIGKAFGEDHWKDGTPPAPKKEVDRAAIMYDKTK